MGLLDYVKLGSLGFKPSEIKDIVDKGIPTDQIIGLAESGYTVADVNELISLSGSEVLIQPGNEELHKTVEPQSSPDNEGEEAADYKAQLEAQAKEADELKKKLQALQMQNASRNLGSGQPEKTSREQFQEALRQLY